MIFFVAPGVWIFPFTKIIKFRMPIGNPLLFKYAIFSVLFIAFLLIGLCHQSRNEKKKVSVPPVYVREPTLDEVREKINDVIGFTRVQFSYFN